MKKVFFTLLAALSLVSCHEKIEAEGPMITDEVAISATASAISVRSAMRLLLSDELAEGEMTITTNDNIHKYIDVVTDGDQIKIRLDDSNSYKGLDVTIEASAKQFSSIQASGASSITIDGESLSFDDYNVALSGASNVEVKNTLNARSCNIKASGASSVHGDDFSTDNLKVDLSGASSVAMGVNNTISGSLSGASSVRYCGEATVSVDCTGASSVKRVE